MRKHQFIQHLASIIILVFCFQACKNSTISEIESPRAISLHKSVKNLSDIIVHDIFSPPVASRIYVYPSIAAYEVMAAFDDGYISFASQLNELPPIDFFPDTTLVIPEVAALYAFNLVGRELIFSTDKMDVYMEDLHKDFESSIPVKFLSASEAFGEKVANHILAWADKDNYKESRSFPKYTIIDDPATWKPTPPAYMEGIEPHWRAIRLLVLETANQFTPEVPTDFNINKGSKFYEELIEVYETVKNANEEEKEIASFWDCNPYVMNLKGHMMFATKKITPGGHWIGITEIACKKENASFMKSTLAYAMASIGLFDGFISCWDEKYRSNLVRPETLINEHIDPEWAPTLQTPPFPEHTSGHSVISSSAAVILTELFGDNFSFEDTVELEYGLPVRKFKSFIHASEEAAISRLYGGIHYRPAIDYGVVQGRKVGNYILENIEYKN
ncbi:MAG: vanadium-dependent haloperoxidase [Bacteroidia bacterium]|nr:vanadium-dependent haloperoxidase [Bacteroidia bacterium]